jgi:5-dehydro-2-deoxygluconokinase
LLGYDGRLYILAFDHRGSFQKKMFGISGDPSPEQTETIKDAKQLIYDGMVRAAEKGVAPEALGVLVDEQFGGSVPQEARKSNLKLAMPVEKSGQNEFDFEYGEQFGEHIESFNPDFSKVLVRYNPEGDAEMNKTQLEKLKRLSDWLHEHDRKFLFELLVPAEAAQLESVGGEEERYDVETRPGLMRQAIAEIQDAGIEADIWKIEGVDSRADNETIAEQTRSGSGRENVKCVVLGRGASNDKVDHWLREAAGVDGFEGFAIGRSIWWDSLKGYLEQGLEREKAVEQVADNYLRFISVYEEAEKAG